MNGQGDPDWGSGFIGTQWTPDWGSGFSGTQTGALGLVEPGHRALGLVDPSGPQTGAVGLKPSVYSLSPGEMPVPYPS